MFLLSEGKMRVFSDFSAVYLLFSVWYSPAKGQIGGTQHYGKRVIEMGKWCQAGNALLLFFASSQMSIIEVIVSNTK